MKTETPRQVAERLAQNFNYAFRGSYVPSAYRDATTAIEVALNAERERCAKIASDKAEEFRRSAAAYGQKSQRTMETSCYWVGATCDQLASEIRGTNAD